jgi:hypothetical protein
MLAIALAGLLVGCGAPATPQIVVVTATFTVPPVVQVVTATYTPTAEGVSLQPQAQEPSVTPLPPTPTATAESLVQPSQPTKAPTQPPVPTDTPPPPPTDTPLPPTETPVPPPTDTPVPPKATTAAKPQASLAAYGVIYSNFDAGDETDENKYSVWIMRGDGQGAREILRPAIEPAYSPNGKKIAYYRPFNGIWVYDLDKKSGAHVVVNDYAEFASFSPDGKQLVFHEWIGNWTGNVHLIIVNADGSNRRQVVEGIRPAWSPVSNVIAFDSCRGTSCGIFVVQANGQGLRQVTSDGGGKASWSPDGKKIVYSAETDGDPEIWVVNLDGSGARQLTKNNGNDTLPVYSPDGLKIFFLSDQNGKAWAIQAMNPDGSGVKTIHKVGVPPRWQFSRLWVGWW